MVFSKDRWFQGLSKLSKMLFIAGSAVLAILFFSVIGVVFAYFSIGLSQEEATVLLGAFGSLSTIALVIVTFVTFIQNQRLTAINNEAPLRREELIQVVLPLIDILDENWRTIANGNVSWWKAHKSGELPSLTYLEEKKWADEVVYRRFSGRNHEIDEDTILCDEALRDLIHAARGAISELREPLKIYIREKEITMRSSTHPDPSKIASYVLNETEQLQDTNTYSEIWDEHQEEFEQVVEEAATEKTTKFYDMREEYLKQSATLSSKLSELRADLQGTFNISIVEKE